MFSYVLEINEDIIDVNNDKAVEEFPEHLIHKSMKNVWGDGEPIRHDQIFVVPPELFQCGWDQRKSTKTLRKLFNRMNLE